MPRTRRTKAASFRPSIETLEARNLLSTYTVDHLADDLVGNGLTGSLRYCLTQAVDGDAITFGVTGTINLTGPLPDLSRSLTILGPGANALTVRRSTSDEYRIFTVDAGAVVTLSGLTIAGGSLTYRTSSFPQGGGIYVAAGGLLTLEYSTLQRNEVRGEDVDTFAPASGGGLYTAGVAIVVDSTITGNSACCQASEGAGAAVDRGGTLVVESSTFSGNNSAGDGGGLAEEGSTVIIANSTLSGNGAAKGGGAIHGDVDRLTNSTINGNSALAGGGGVSGNVHARNTIIAGNDSIDSPSPDLFGSLGSLGYNLIGNSQGGSDFAPTDLLNVDPMLGRLQDNGGPTQTMALLPGSPALNAGDPYELGTTDQRGVIRTGGVNIGAFQASASAFLVAAPATVTAGMPFDVTITAVDPFGQVAVGYTGTVTFRTSDPDPGVVLPADYTFTLEDGGSHTFTDTGLGETTLLTPGDQTLTVMDTADNTITGSAVVTVSGTAPGAGSSEPAHRHVIAMDWLFASRHRADGGFTLARPWWDDESLFV